MNQFVHSRTRVAIRELSLKSGHQLQLKAELSSQAERDFKCINAFYSASGPCLQNYTSKNIFIL